MVGGKLPEPIPTGDPEHDYTIASCHRVLLSFQNGLLEFGRDVDRMAECDFSVHPPSDGMLGPLQRRLGVTASNVAEALRQMTDFSTIIQSQILILTDRNQALKQRTDEQAEALTTVDEHMAELTGVVNRNADSATRAESLANNAAEVANAGQTELAKMVESIEQIRTSSDSIGEFVGTIEEIAFQTNILALNAAVEAARAGEQGRSFAVVANEVRTLAQRCGEASKNIQAAIEQSQQCVRNGQRSADAATSKISLALQGTSESAVAVSEISAGTNEQLDVMRRANDALVQIEAFTRANRELTNDVAADVQLIGKQVGHLNDSVHVFVIPSADQPTHEVHARMQRVAETAADRAGTLLWKGVQNRDLTLEDCFDTDYQAIANTDPTKYQTRFDQFTDSAFPALQESLLDSFDFVVYAGAVDRNGYFPTHNQRFSKPLTGDRLIDLANNRTKRIYDDRVGQTCGSNTDPWKLQTYRRDTGELMFDMSAPIYVNGQHWGGFRIGYRIA